MSGDEARNVALARQGDGHAFRRLVDAHARPLFGVCVRITHDPALAEDAVQEALFNAYRHLPQFDGRAGFGTWLHRIGVNAALEQMRKRGRFDSIAAESERDEAPMERFADEAPGPEQQAHGQEIGRSIERQLARLSTLERTAFVLRHHEGQSLEDISAALSLSINGCKQAIFRAVRKLRLALTPLEKAS
jgi:RNA polymerase sigma-70 factor (ECF subfamily)